MRMGLSMKQMFRCVGFVFLLALGGLAPVWGQLTAPTGLQLDPSADTGSSNNDGITKLTSGLLITGSADPLATRIVFLDGATTLTSTTAAAFNGSGIALALAEGTHNLTAYVADATTRSALSAVLSIVVDTTAPTAVIGAPTRTAVNSSNTADFPIIYSSDAIVSLPVAGLNISTGGTGTYAVQVLNTSSQTPTVRFLNCTGDGVVYFNIKAATATDLAGNVSPVSAYSQFLTIDNVPPSVSLGSPFPAATYNGPVDYSIAYAGATTVTLSTADITLNATGTATGFATLLPGGGNGLYSVRITAIAGNGSLSISLAAGTAVDDAGNLAPAVGPSTQVGVNGLASGTTLDWNQMVPAAPFAARWYHTVLNFNSRLWVICGRNDAPLADVWSSGNGLNWTQETADTGFPAVAIHTSVVYNGRMWVIGGQLADGSLSAAVYSSADGSTWNTATTNGGFVPRDGHASATFLGRMWIVGGYGPAGPSDRNRNDIYSSNDGVTWNLENGTPGFSPRHEHALVVFNNKLWVIGGRDKDGELSDIWSSSDGINWVLGATFGDFPARHGHQVLEKDGQLWLIGGVDANGNALSDTWNSPDGVNWFLAPPYRTYDARRNFGAALFNGEMWLVGGMGSGFLNDVWSSAFITAPPVPTPTPTPTATPTPVPVNAAAPGAWTLLK
jgi:hypothetical protein